MRLLVGSPIQCDLGFLGLIGTNFSRCRWHVIALVGLNQENWDNPCGVNCVVSVLGAMTA